jgi:putative peptidoglycan lipid II flippase
MFALAVPTVDLIFRGGSFSRADSHLTALYFAVFTVSLALWASQAIYSRAFFAAGETFSPMLAGTIVTAVSIPIYWLLHQRYGVIGLAWASNLAILLHTLTLAMLLHRRGMVSLSGLNRPELAKSLLAAVVSLGGVTLLLRTLPHPASQTYTGDLIALAAGGAAWIALCYTTLRLTGSSLPHQILRRR